MRKLLMVAMVAGLCVGMSQDAAANYFFPGKVVIGGGGGGGTGGTTGGSTTVAMGGCQVDQVVCECFTDKPLLEACKATGVQLGCLTADTPYQHVEQSEPVISEGKIQVLGELRCTGESNMTAFVQLPIEKP